MHESGSETVAEGQLRALERLRATGTVTDNEYERKRTELLDRALAEMAAAPHANEVVADVAPQAQRIVQPDSPYPFPWRWAAAAAASLGTLLVLIALLLPRVTVSSDVFATTTLGWSTWTSLAIWSAILGGSIVFTALFHVRGARKLSYGYIVWWAVQGSYLGYDAYIDSQPSNWQAADSSSTQAGVVMLQWENGFYLLCAGLVLVLAGAVLLCRWQWRARSRTMISPAAILSS